MRKRNFTSLEVLAEQVRKVELQIFASQGRGEVRKQNFTYLAVGAERKCGSGTSRFWLSVQNESADVELQIFGSKDRAEAELQLFGSQGRAEMRKRNIGLWHSRHSRSVEAEFEIFSRQDRAEVRKQHCRSLIVK